MRILLSVIAALSLLLGQMHALAHKADVDAHKDGHACEFCLHASTLKHTACGALPPACEPAIISFDVPSDPRCTPGLHALYSRARAPPFSPFPV